MKISDDMPVIAPTRAAQLLNCSYRTVIAWSRKGILPYIRDSAGRRLYSRAAIQQLLKEREAVKAAGAKPRTS